MIKPCLVLLSAAVFALPGVITLSLKHTGENVVGTQNHIQSFITELTVQELIEYELIGDGITLDKAHQELTAARTRAAEHLGKAAVLGLSADVVDRIEAATHNNIEKVDALMLLLASGSSAEAAEFDEAQVDPTFDQLSAFLANQTARMEREAKTAQQHGDFGVLLTVLLSLLLVSMVQSRRRRADVRDQARHQGEARYRTLIDQSSDLVLVVDRTGRTSFVSPSVNRVLATEDQNRVTAANGPGDADLIDFVAAVDPLDRPRFCSVLQTAVPASMSTGEFRLNGRHGTSTFEMTVQDLTGDPSVGGLVLTAHDVTERLALQHEMEHRVLHDDLTGLPNRALLADRFDQALIGAERSGASVGLLLLDLDRFKEVNDTYGHHFGDELLRQIGPRLTGVLRGGDTIARLGGDEFAVLLQDIHEVEDATKVANMLLTALSLPFHVEGVDLDVDGSVGVVISGAHGHDAVTLMKHADIAMYIAKGQRLGVFAYDPTVDRHSSAKLAMAGDLRRGSGAGYTSPSQLKALPIDEPQIDRVTLRASVTGHALSFAGGVAHDQDNQSDHVVFFFHGSQELMREVTRYVSESLNHDGHAVVIATPGQTQALRAALPQRRLERAEREGRFLALDAEQTLSLFMVDGSPDPVLFERHLGSMVRSHRGETGVLSVCCELVAVLCREGNLIGALQLEELWNELQHSASFSLFCAHPLADARAQPADRLAQICLRHTRVHMSQLPDPDQTQTPDPTPDPDPDPNSEVKTA